jgi:hypothetical protein
MQTLRPLEVETANDWELDHRPEIRHRYDTMTWLAEVLDGPMSTSFEYIFDGHELYGADGGSLGRIFHDALKDAKRVAAENPNLAFEVRRRDIENDEYHDMIKMAQGELPNTMIVVSDFPPELMGAAQDIGGYNTRRKQTMLRVISSDGDGKLTMVSRSLDRSDRQALESIYGYFELAPKPGELLGQRIHRDLPAEEQAFLADWLTGAYDRALSSRYGGDWHGGRTPAEMINTYDFVQAQGDLVDTFVAAKLNDSAGAERLRYGLAAATDTRFKKRFGSIVTSYVHPHHQPAYHLPPLNEMEQAGILARTQGKTYSACGLTDNGQGELATPEQMAAAGYGNKTSGKESWKWKKGICRTSSCPTRPAATKVGPCSICTGCQSLYDKGKDPEYEYKQMRDNAGNN